MDARAANIDALHGTAGSGAPLKVVPHKFSVGILLADGHRRCVYVSSKAAELLAIEAESALGRDLRDVLGEVELPIPDPSGSAETPSGAPVQGALRVGPENGEGRQLLYLAATAQFDEDSNGVVIELRDPRREREAELALSESEERFRSLSRCSPVGIFVTTVSGLCTYTNPSCQSICGFSFRGSLGYGWVEAMHHEDRARVEAAWRSAAPAAAEFTADVRFMHPDGTVRWTRVSTAPLFSDEGLHIGHVGTVQDTTDVKMSMLAVQESETRFRQLADAMPQIVWVTDSAGNSEYFNSRWYQYIGEPLESRSGSLLSAIDQKVIHPDDLTQADFRWRAAIEAGIDYESEHRLRRYDGQYRWHLVRAVAERGSDGSVAHWFGTATDIHERKESEHALRSIRDRLEQTHAASRANEERLRVALAASYTGTFKWDAARKVFTEFDSELKMLFEIRHEEPIVHLRDLEPRVHPDDWSGLSASLLRCVPEEVFENEFRILLAGGHVRWLYARGQVENGALVGACTNISRRKRVEYEREALLESERVARTEAERASRLKDEFLAMLSHELRTPLNAILGWAQLLERRIDDPALLREALPVIIRNSRAQTQLIDDLLDLSRIDTGKLHLELHPVGLQIVVHGAVSSLAPAARAKGVSLTTHLDESAPAVLGDASRLQQVVWNLLSNAVKFTPPDGKVEVLLRRAGDTVQLEVRDTGIGIEAGVLPHIFERFRQADSSITRAHGGLGIGLSIVRQLVELHGGTVAATSEGSGCGASFVVTLPVPTSGAGTYRSGSTAHVRDEQVDLRDISVLVVEDDADSRALVRRSIEECGGTVVTAASVEDAMVEFSKEPPDVLLTDIGMPKEDGYELIRWIRTLPEWAGGRTPAAALTAYVTNEDRTRALHAGFETHLSKPIEPRQLQCVVAALCGRIATRGEDDS